MHVVRIDHLVLTVIDVKETCDFYSQTLGMEVVIFGGGRKALVFGEQKINLHQVGQKLEPKANKPTVGSADLCFITEASLLKKRICVVATARSRSTYAPVRLRSNARCA
jgi:catechol 2,3-dioxygenase-like lactoylglutathione lyase family enzyme